MGGDKEAQNRGHVMSVGDGGDVKGSGAGAGSGGAPEDYDSDEASGGTQPALPVDKSEITPSHN